MAVVAGLWQVAELQLLLSFSAPVLASPLSGRVQGRWTGAAGLDGG